MHPNFKKDVKKKKYKGCKKYLHRCDEMILKPVLIYRYERQMMRRSQEFFHIFQNKGDEIEEDYKKENQ